jgi:hypothetical protein
MKFLLMAAELGLNVLFCMPNRTNCILFERRLRRDMECVRRIMNVGK